MSCCLCFAVAWSTAHKVIHACWRFVCVVAVFSLLCTTLPHRPHPLGNRFSLHILSLSSITHTDCTFSSFLLPFSLRFFSLLSAITRICSSKRTVRRHSQNNSQNKLLSLHHLHCFSCFGFCLLTSPPPRSGCNLQLGELVLALPIIVRYLDSINTQD